MSGFEDAVKKEETPSPTFETAATKAEVPSQESNSVTPLENGSIVVNGKIYQPEAAAKKIEHADMHIQTLEKENAEKDQAAVKLIERIEALERSRNHNDALDQLVSQAANSIPAPAPIEQPPAQEVSKEELVQAAVDTIKAEQVALQQEANLNACIANAQAAYGDAFGAKVDEQGARHGMNLEQVMEMAKNQPSVFNALFVPEQTPGGIPDTTGSTLGGSTGLSDPIVPKAKSYLKMSAKQRHEEITRRMNALSN